MTKYKITIQLTILGPFLTSATSSNVYGLQKTFHRNTEKNPVIPASHIKGKLRMAMEELADIKAPGFTVDINNWFGEASDEESYEPLPGLLTFSDFQYSGETKKSTRKRTAINTKSGTAAENQLREIEDLFLSGVSTIWKGTVTFYALNEAEANQIKTALHVGFSWLTNLGAEKSIGFGRLAEVVIDKPDAGQEDEPIFTSDFLGNSESVHLRIQPIERIMIGGIKKPRANFVRSERIIPGSAIKGALTTCLNQAHGIHPYHTPLSKESAERMLDFQLLSEWFDRIRVTHAFPARVDQPRPVKKPISTVEVSGIEYDLALTQDPLLLINGQTPTYFIDRKRYLEYFGEALPKEAFVTRTEIDDQSRRSQESNLFTYSFLCPEDTNKDSKDEKKYPIEWICNVDFESVDQNVREQVRNQFAKAVSTYLDRLGKLNQSVKIQVRPGYAPPIAQSKDLIVNGEILLTLQTDTIMLNPDDVGNLAIGNDLFALYADFWKEISTQNVSGACLELVDYFAHQNFQGGYLYYRYLGSWERDKTPNNYYPYYLTGAGSVFRLRVTDESRANEFLQKWLHGGLDLPKWAEQVYSKNGRRALWQTCPFGPENGYGEIFANLNWHWEKQPI